MPTKEQIANLLEVLATASIIVIGWAVGSGTFAEIIKSMGSELSSAMFQQAGRKLKTRWLSSDSGILNQDIQNALTRAFIAALSDLKGKYFNTGEAHKLPENEKKTIELLFRDLKKQAQEVFASSLERAAKEQVVKEYLLATQDAAADKIWKQINGEDLLFTYNKDFKDFLRSKLLDEVRDRFYEELKKDKMARITFQLLLLEKIAVNQIKVLEDRVKPQPELQRNVFEEDDQNGLNRFLYGAQKTPFLGREKEMEELENFLADEKSLCWWMVTGEGGVGKSRLALELCLRREKEKWRAGFLPSSFSREDYKNWEPSQPTLIIADYAAFRAIEIGHIIRMMKTHANGRRGFPHPVRLLLLERNIIRYYEEKPYDTDVRDEEWFRKGFLGGGTRTDRQTTISASYANVRTPIMLRSLSEDETWAIICTFGKEKVQEKKKGEILAALKKIDPLCRPLYAALLGDAIGADRNYEQLGTLEILSDILEREEEKFWIPAWDLAGITGREDRDNDKDILALATMAGDIDTESASLPAEIEELITKESFSPKRYALMAVGSTDTLLRSLKPDILGEVFVLDYLKPENPLQTRKIDRIRKIAWLLSENNMASFMARVSGDFPDHPTLKYLLKSNDL